MNYYFITTIVFIAFLSRGPNQISEDKNGATIDDTYKNLIIPERRIKIQIPEEWNFYRVPISEQELTSSNSEPKLSDRQLVVKIDIPDEKIAEFLTVLNSQKGIRASHRIASFCNVLHTAGSPRAVAGWGVTGRTVCCKTLLDSGLKQEHFDETATQRMRSSRS